MEDYTYIYALRDPDTKKVRYIGKSNNPALRLQHHLTTGINAQKFEWIKGLKRCGMEPEIIILEECPKDSFKKAENSWIHFFLDNGCQLTNAIYRGYKRADMLKASKYNS